MRQRTRLLTVGALAVAVVGTACGFAVAQEVIQRAISDADISLLAGSVFDVPAPPVAKVNVSDPGDMSVAARAYPSAPPRVPHAVEDFLPITRDDNWCVDCHMLDWTAPDADEPTPISSTHYMDLRSDSDDIGENVAGARWVCVSCHVPVTDEVALVANTFGG